jgi:hypothetical protein
MLAASGRGGMIWSAKCNHWSEPGKGEAYFQYLAAEMKQHIYEIALQ